MTNYHLKNERRIYPVSQSEFEFLTEGNFGDRQSLNTIARKVNQTEALLNPEWKAFQLPDGNTLKIYSYEMVIDIIRKDYQYPIYEQGSLPRRIKSYGTVNKGCFGRFRERHLELATCALCLCDHDIKYCTQIQSKLICVECRQEITVAKATANIADYIAKKRLATPTWANLEAIERIYAEARCLTLKTGIQYEVDHFYPIRGKQVSGLHWEGNLQIITAEANKKKSNKLI